MPVYGVFVLVPIPEVHVQPTELLVVGRERRRPSLANELVGSPGSLALPERVSKSQRVPSFPGDVSKRAGLRIVKSKGVIAALPCPQSPRPST